MEKKILFKLTVTALLSFSSFECVASEAILKGLEIAVPRARRLLSSLMTPDDLLKGLERAAPKAKLILENCTTKLPDEFLLVRNSANNLSGTVLQFRKMVADTPREEQRAFVSTFYGSSLDRSIRNELDQIRAVANRDPRIYDLDAYKNVEKISDDLGIE